MYKQLTSEQRSQIAVLLATKTAKKVIADMLQCMNKNTIAYYDSMINLIKTADSTQVVSLSFSEMLGVLNYRQMYLTNQIEQNIEKLDGSIFFD